MRYALKFKATKDVVLPISNQHIVNSYVHNVLGRNNKYHDNVTKYNISGIFGAKLTDKNNVTVFKDTCATIIISSNNNEFNADFYSNLLNNRILFDGLELSENIRIQDEIFIKGNTFETITPVLINEFIDTKSNKQRQVTVNDKNFDEVFEKHILNILKKNLKLYDDDFNKIKITVYDKFRRSKVIKVNNIYNYCSHITFKIEGSLEASQFLYDNGIGLSRGCGFGMIIPTRNHDDYVENFFNL